MKTTCNEIKCHFLDRRNKLKNNIMTFKPVCLIRTNEVTFLGRSRNPGGAKAHSNSNTDLGEHMDIDMFIWGNPLGETT